MKLIIDIDEAIYDEFMKENNYEVIYDGYWVAKSIANGTPYEQRPKVEWNILSEDSLGIHEIECPFCKYSKGSDFSAVLTVTFDKLPPFCENCGAELKGEINENRI